MITDSRFLILASQPNKKGFSTILALLLTGFLVTLAAGILFLFLSENRINQSLFSGTAAYHASEWALEYALLKIKNHREWFSDELSLKGNEGKILANNSSRDANIGYEIIATGTSYSGMIAPDSFEIIPLFHEDGRILKTENGKVWKDPRNPVTPTSTSPFYNRVALTDFDLKILSGDRIVWNVIGNNTLGNTFGISWVMYTTLPSSLPLGTQVQQGLVNAASKGTYRTYQAGVLSETTKTVGSFISSFDENYLVLYNSSTMAVKYSLQSKNALPFTLPKVQIISSGKVTNSMINLQMTEDKSRLYDILKYSLFVPQ